MVKEMVKVFLILLIVVKYIKGIEKMMMIGNGKCIFVYANGKFVSQNWKEYHLIE